MAVTNIPDEHHVVRHCKARLVRRVDGITRGVFPEAFHLRGKTEDRPQETYLSSIYFEYFDADKIGRLQSCCSSMAFRPKPRDAMILVNAGCIRAEGKKRERQIRVTHEPKSTNKAYAAIRGIPITPDDELANALAQVATLEAIDISAI